MIDNKAFKIFKTLPAVVSCEYYFDIQVGRSFVLHFDIIFIKFVENTRQFFAIIVNFFTYRPHHQNCPLDIVRCFANNCIFFSETGKASATSWMCTGPTIKVDNFINAMIFKVNANIYIRYNNLDIDENITIN